MRASGKLRCKTRKLASTRSTSSTRHGVAGCCSARNRAIFGVIAPGLPLAGRPPEQGDGRELTERSNEPATKRLPERLTSLRNHEGQRHVRCCVGADIGPLPPRRKPESRSIRKENVTTPHPTLRS